MENTIKSVRPDNYWFYDYETFTASQYGGSVAQFAAVLTDSDFNILEQHNFYCELSQDMVPQLGACLVTGLTPQAIDRVPEGNKYSEFDFIGKIESLFLSRKNSIICGYNSIYFDDEWTRTLLYRNLRDPYQWAYKNFNKRFDGFNLIRMVHSLRPDILKWREVPRIKDDVEVGKRVTHKLEFISSDNGILHESAHDALSDVIALIELCKLVRERAPEVYEYALNASMKQNCVEVTGKNFAHFSHFYTDTGGVNLLKPLVLTTANSVISWNLSIDASHFLGWSKDEMLEYASLKADQREEKGHPREKPFIWVKHNASPAIAPSASLSGEGVSQRTGLSAIRESIAASQKTLLENLQYFNEFAVILDQCKRDNPYSEPNYDSDFDIYTSSFLNDMEKRHARSFVECETWEERYAYYQKGVMPPRVESMAFRIIGRNAPDILNEVDREIWWVFCKERITGIHPSTSLDMSGDKYSLAELEKDLKDKIESLGEEQPCRVIVELSEYVSRLKSFVGLSN